MSPGTPPHPTVLRKDELVNDPAFFRAAPRNEVLLKNAGRALMQKAWSSRRAARRGLRRALTNEEDASVDGQSSAF